ATDERDSFVPHEMERQLAGRQRVILWLIGRLSRGGRRSCLTRRSYSVESNCNRKPNAQTKSQRGPIRFHRMPPEECSPNTGYYLILNDEWCLQRLLFVIINF